MATNHQTNENENGANASKTAIAVGAAAAAALAAAGAYWFYGAHDAAKHRKSARGWMLRARADVLDGVHSAIERMGEIDKETYAKIVENVLVAYRKGPGVTEEELQQVARDMQSMWQHMQKARKVATPKKAAKKGLKKASAKPAKKTAPKKAAAKKSAKKTTR